MLRLDQIAVLRWVLEAIGDDAPVGPLPEIDLARLQAAGVATGLTAALGAMAARRGVALPDEWAEFVSEQTAVVADRRQRYGKLTPRVLGALDEAGVRAVPVKGAVIADDVWPVPDARPMADIDVIVPADDRRRAVRALVSIGLQHHDHTPDEDTLLAWGDGSVGLTDRESAAHNGKVELHRGWAERFHHYTIGDDGWLWATAQPGALGGAACWLLPRPALAVQALGHLSGGVVRAEVRAVNVVDVALLIAGLGDSQIAAFADHCDRLDPRLSAPGLWLVGATRPRWMVTPGFEAITYRQMARLRPEAARRLAQAEPGDVLRELGARTSIGWRLAFTHTPTERVAMLRQAASPPTRDLAVAHPGEGVLGIQARRVGRAARRLRAR